MDWFVRLAALGNVLGPSRAAVSALWVASAISFSAVSFERRVAQFLFSCLMSPSTFTTDAMPAPIDTWVRTYSAIPVLAWYCCTFGGSIERVISHFTLSKHSREETKMKSAAVIHAIWISCVTVSSFHIKLDGNTRIEQSRSKEVNNHLAMALKLLLTVREEKSDTRFPSGKNPNPLSFLLNWLFRRVLILSGSYHFYDKIQSTACTTFWQMPSIFMK